MPNMIFHIPYRIDPEAMSAPMIRPRKMIDAFRSLGYEVDIVQGYSKERIETMKRIKQQILEGKKYELAYAESSSVATMFTDPDHFPRHPFADFSFFRFLKRHGIKIGLFYRDIYWKFDEYWKDGNRIKAAAGILAYQYDLWNYMQTLSKLYVPTLKLYELIKCRRFDGLVEALPPGCDSDQNETASEPLGGRKLHVFYVGGVGSHYKIEELIKAISECPNAELTICCREKEWNQNIDRYKAYMCDRVQVIHKNNNELVPFYQWADITSLMFEPSPYRNLAMPFKAFEYLAYLKPVLATRETAIGDFVSENRIGFCIDNTKDAIKTVLEEIVKQPQLLDEYRETCTKVREDNTWQARGLQVINGLK